MCLINVAHGHFITQAGRKSKPALKSLMGVGGPRVRELTYGD